MQTAALKEDFVCGGRWGLFPSYHGLADQEQQQGLLSVLLRTEETERGREGSGGKGKDSFKTSSEQNKIRIIFLNVVELDCYGLIDVPHPYFSPE